jgi:hypothetical protein
MPPNNLGRDSFTTATFMPFMELAVIALWPVAADGVVPRWRSALGFTPWAGVAPRAGVVARECAMLAAASTNEATPEANEPNKEDGCDWVASARIAPGSAPEKEFDNK